MKNGETVKAFEREFAEYVGAKYAIALCNGTATLHTALVALGVKPGDLVAVPPLTMSATTIAVLHAGAIPIFRDVDPATWLMEPRLPGSLMDGEFYRCAIPVSLYGLHAGSGYKDWRPIDDAAQTLRPHNTGAAFTSYSFQASKILALGEGGMLTTNDEDLAQRAREFSSLGYRMRADQPRLDPDALKSPTFDRHYSLGWNYRMSDLVAAEGLRVLSARVLACRERMVPEIGELLLDRSDCATMYRDAITNCDWLTPQHVPEGWRHDYWTFAVACDTPARALALADAVVKHGGERPYPCWKLAYEEPAFSYLTRGVFEKAQRAADKVAKYNSNFARANIMLGEWESGKTQAEIARDRGLSVTQCSNQIRRAIRARERGSDIYRPDPQSAHVCPVAESLQPRILQFQCNDLVSAERNASALKKAIEELS